MPTEDDAMAFDEPLDENKSYQIEDLKPFGIHSFYIPVMGTGFTLDTPIRVARFGITSVVSIGDDILIEKMREFHCRKAGLPYKPIEIDEKDARARRITAYLNLVNEIVTEQTGILREASFEDGGEIVRYFELLPEGKLKNLYRQMAATDDSETKRKRQDSLRRFICPGRIDVNIMTKIDGVGYRNGTSLPPEDSVAKSAFRGFAKSELNSSIVLSAGLNRSLFTYMAQFPDFFPDGSGKPKKRIVLKVSDFRSAQLQAIMLAKLGLWVSEFRIESGLNCGGHAFPTKGHLMGPILQEFNQSRQFMIDQLFSAYQKSNSEIGHHYNGPPEIIITVQGGIGTHYEDDFLINHYHAAGTGWGTPFLLVPEATNVDADHLRKLASADNDDVYLGNNSPLGIPFWILKNSASEEERKKRIESGHPGSPCPKRFLGSDDEFSSAPICRASRKYQKQKIHQLEESDLPSDQKEAIKKEVLGKSCLCVGLAGGVEGRNNLNGHSKTTVCCGPNIMYFDKIYRLEEMLDHIYGRCSLLSKSTRPHMFITELKLYIEFLRQELKLDVESSKSREKYLSEFRQNLLQGIEYYRQLAREQVGDPWDKFIIDLENNYLELKQLISETLAGQPKAAFSG